MKSNPLSVDVDEFCDPSARSTLDSPVEDEDAWFRIDPNRAVIAVMPSNVPTPPSQSAIRKTSGAGRLRRRKASLHSKSDPQRASLGSEVIEWSRVRGALPTEGRHAGDDDEDDNEVEAVPHARCATLARQVTTLKHLSAVYNQVAAAVAAKSALYPNRATELEGVASDVRRELHAAVEETAARVRARKNEVFKQRARVLAEPLLRQIAEVKAESDATVRRIHAGHEWKVTATRLLTASVDALKTRIGQADVQTQFEYEELALLQQQTSALFEKQAQMTLDVATLDATKERISQLIEANERVIDVKNTLTETIESQQRAEQPREDTIQAYVKTVRNELKLTRARQSLVDRRLQQKNAQNAKLKAELDQIASRNDTLTEQLESLKAEYAAREAAHLRDWTPRPEHRDDEPTALDARSTVARAELTCKKANSAANNARKLADEFARLCRLLLPLADVESGTRLQAPFDGLEDNSDDVDDQLQEEDSDTPMIECRGYAANALGAPAFLSGTKTVAAPLWPQHQTEKLAVQLVRLMGQTASSSTYLQQLQPKQGFANPTEALQFRLTECALKAASVLPSSAVSDLSLSSAQLNAATRQSLLHFVTCCSRYSRTSEVCSVALRVLAGSLPMSIFDTPILALQRVVSQTPTDSPGCANVKSVYASLLKEFAMLGAFDTVMLRYAVLIDAAASGNGGSTSVRLHTLLDSAPTSDVNRRVGLFLRTAIKAYVRQYEAVMSALEGAVRPLIVDSETTPGLLLVSASRVRNAWDRVRVDANALAPALGLAKITNESKLLVLGVKAFADAVFAELPSLDGAQHGLSKQHSPSFRQTSPHIDGSGGSSKRRSTVSGGAGTNALSASVVLGGSFTSDPSVSEPSAVAGGANDYVDATLLSAVMRTVQLRISV